MRHDLTASIDSAEAALRLLAATLGQLESLRASLDGQPWEHPSLAAKKIQAARALRPLVLSLPDARLRATARLQQAALLDLLRAVDARTIGAWATEWGAEGDRMGAGTKREDVVSLRLLGEAGLVAMGGAREL
jgi:hypothetical protein